MDALLYVWDQYMIGLDTPGFNVEWLAIATTVMLGLLKDKMRECNSVSVFHFRAQLFKASLA